MKTQDLLGALAEQADGDFSAAQTLPPQVYHDQAFHELELERIFRKEWICMGRLAEIPDAGDYTCRDVIDTPVLVVRQRDGGVKAFANICAHRAARLLTGDGHATRISCPYHSWTYNLDGRLVGAPFMQHTPGFDVAAYRLTEFACDTWEGFIYVSCSPTPQPLHAQLQSLSGLIGDFRMADYIPVFSQTDVWDTNWKCLVENYMDAYHIHRVHKNSFGMHGSSEEQTKLVDGQDAFSYHYVEEDDGPMAIQVAAANTWLTSDNRKRTYLINVFPSHTMQLQPDMLWYLSILPRGTEQLEVRWAVSVPGELLDSVDDRQAHIDELIGFLHQVNGEDKPIVENICRTTRSQDASRGPLSYLERNVWQFGRYLGRLLVD